MRETSPRGMQGGYCKEGVVVMYGKNVQQNSYMCELDIYVNICHIFIN